MKGKRSKDDLLSLQITNENAIQELTSRQNKMITQALGSAKENCDQST